MRILIVLCLVSFSSFAQDILRIRPPKKKTVAKTKTVSKVNIPRVNSEVLNTLRKIEAQNEKLNSELGVLNNKPSVWDFTNQFDFQTGTVFKALLLNSVVSTNLETPLLVEIEPGQGVPSGTKFSCTGVTKHKRVVSACNRLIIPNAQDEYEVQVSLLNTDGSSGLKADYYYTGKEEFVAATVASSFARGVIELQTDRIATPLGQLTTNTAKNRVMNGALNSLDEVNGMMKEEMQSREPKVYIGAGKHILVYFHERFKL